MDKINPNGMKKEDLTDAMFRLLQDKFPEFEDQRSYAEEFEIDLEPRKDDENYNYKAMQALVVAIQADDEVPAEQVAAPPKPNVVYYRGPVRSLGVRATIQGAVSRGDGTVQMQPLCGPIHLVFGASPHGVCMVDEAFASSHRDPSGKPLTLAQMIEIIESTPEFLAGEFRRISEAEVKTLPARGDKKLGLVRGAVSVARKA